VNPLLTHSSHVVEKCYWLTVCGGDVNGSSRV
jgi:hypothetical protein